MKQGDTCYNFYIVTNIYIVVVTLCNMKLKTLKDFDECILNDKNCCVPHFKEELKAEAIKWVKEDIKEIKTRQHIEDNDLCLSMIGHLQLQKNKWIDFFNITEEDLK